MDETIHIVGYSKSDRIRILERRIQELEEELATLKAKVAFLKQK